MIQYKIDGSSELRSIDVPETCTDKELCDSILKTLFGDSPPTCDLVVCERGDVVLLSRVYAKKFEAIPKFQVETKRRRALGIKISATKTLGFEIKERNRRY